MAKTSLSVSQSSCKYQTVDNHKKFIDICYQIVGRLSILEEAIQNSNEIKSIVNTLPVLNNIDSIVELFMECSRILMISKEGV